MPIRSGHAGRTDCHSVGETMTMRVKQLLGILLLTAATTALAAGSASQFAGVHVENRDQASVVTILANGPFTHTEYRPTENLMLVDLAGVSAGSQDAALHAVSSVGVQSDRVVGYRSASGSDVARVELSLAHGTTAKVNDISGGVEVRVSSTASVKAASGAIETRNPNRISGITVARGKDGLNVEITGNSSITAKTIERPIRPYRI